MWKKFQKFPPHELQDMSFWIHKNPIFGLAKKWLGNYILQGQIFMKNVQNGSNSWDSFFKSSWIHAWKNFDHLEL